MKIKKMLRRYAAEKIGKVKDRKMLNILVKRNRMTISDAAKSLGKSPSWGSKWYRRYLEVGFDRLADKPRSGRPPKVSKPDMKKIRKNIRRTILWTGRMAQEYIMKRTGVKYNPVYVRYILRRWGYTQKTLVGRHARRASKDMIREFQEMLPEAIQEKISQGFAVGIQDEAIITADPRPRRRGYTRKGERATFTQTGSHSKTIVHGLITLDGRGMFRQYDAFTKETVADFLRQAVYKFKKICLIMDKASQHRSAKVQDLVKEIDGLEIIFLPTACPDLSAIEEYWRQLKRAVLDVPYLNLDMLRKAITRYTRYKKPNLVVENFLYRAI